MAEILHLCIASAPGIICLKVEWHQSTMVADRVSSVFHWLRLNHVYYYGSIDCVYLKAREKICMSFAFRIVCADSTEKGKLSCAEC